MTLGRGIAGKLLNLSQQDGKTHGEVADRRGDEQEGGKQQVLGLMLM